MLNRNEFAGFERYDEWDFLHEQKSQENSIVRCIYNKISFAYGKFNSHYVKKFWLVFFYALPIVFALSFIPVIISMSLTKPEDVWIGILVLIIDCVFGVIVYFGVRNRERDVYFYKNKSGNITFYKDDKKQTLVVDLRRGVQFMYSYKTKSWYKHEDVALMGRNLLFEHLVGNMWQTEKADKTIIFAQNAPQRRLKNAISAKLFLQNGEPTEINYYPYIIEEFSRNDTPMRFRFLNTENICLEVPKSFLSICKEKGIEPLEENEHLHYV